MGSLFGGGGNKMQMMMMMQQLAMQQKQQERLDAQERDQKAQLLARQRAATFGGSRSLMSSASLQPNATLGGGTDTSNPASGAASTLGSSA